jgi:hypothetical protein
MASILTADEKEPEIRTRSGYKPAECLKAFQTAMNESGVIATGRALHFSADLVCSGGYDVWVRAIWDFAIEHIGIGSPRIFVYLKKRIGELDGLVSRLDEETLYKDEEFQTRVSEIIFVIRECPRKSRIPWPKVGLETHRDGWLKAVSTNATETEVVKRVFKSGSDMFPLHSASCELLKALGDGATEKTLFWARWILDEDHRLRKENKGSGLSTLDRGPATMRGKNKSEACYYLQQLFGEAYKEYAGKQMIRMSEEFQALIDLFRGSDPRISARGRKDILALMAQILCEVPRWKVPAAPALIKDPVTLSRTISQSANFFKEVLVEPKVNLGGKHRSIFKGKETTKLRDKIKKGATMEDQMEAYEAAMNAYLSK